MNANDTINEMIDEQTGNLESYKKSIIQELNTECDFAKIELHAREARYCQERIIELTKSLNNPSF